MNVEIVKTHPNAQIPKKATDGSVGYDLYLPYDVTIVKGRQVVCLELKVALPILIIGFVDPRSGFSSKGMEDMYGERKDADVIIGIVDPDYRGKIGVIIKSNEDVPFVLKKGTKIAQFVPVKAEDVQFMEVESLDSTERGEGGFGSTK